MTKYEFRDSDRSLMEKSSIPFAIFQLINRRIIPLVLSDGFCRLFGYDDRQQACESMTLRLFKNIHPDDYVRISDVVYTFMLKQEKAEVIYRIRRRDGDGYRIIHAIGEPIETEEGIVLHQILFVNEGVYKQGKDPEEYKLNNLLNTALHEESILASNRYNQLTGLLSMTAFFDMAKSGREAIYEDGMTPTMLYADLSGMRYYNHKYGFAEGDRLLIGYADILSSRFGHNNCCYFGGDHFAIYTPLEGLTEKLEEVFQEGKKLNGGKSLPIHFGIYTNNIEWAEPSTACDRAKYACDIIKKSYESGYIFFEPYMLEDISRKDHIVTHLNTAIQEGWIQVYYQPIIRSSNGRVCHEEALARWIDPVKGFLSPADFIPILEESRLIYKLDLHVLDLVLDKLKTQVANGIYPASQSINLSRTDFDRCDMVEEIRSRVDKAGIARNLISVEITESVIAKDFEFMKKQIQRFRDLGFQVWMDDFGSGYSSLDILQTMDFDLIKFDLNFLRRLDEGEKGRIIMTELMKMAGSLGLDTVCEGVETEQQVEFLQNIGCAKMQGYYYLRPIPFEKIVERYDRGTQIGIENPEESEYYEAIGKINLYDLDVIAAEGDGALKNYFNTLPMAVIELNGSVARFVRFNQSYRDFTKRCFHVTLNQDLMTYHKAPLDDDSSFMRSLRHCARYGGKFIVDERLEDKVTIHAFVRRVAVNPVTKTAAIVIAILSVTDDEKKE